MKTFGKQSKGITLKRIGGDEFKFDLEVGVYYINNKETGVFISVVDKTVFFDTFEEYWNGNLDKNAWEEILSETMLHDEVTANEATALNHVVEELRKEVYTGINQLYLDDETWITGLFVIVV